MHAKDVYRPLLMAAIGVATPIGVAAQVKGLGTTRCTLCMLCPLPLNCQRDDDALSFPLQIYLHPCVTATQRCGYVCRNF